jgi:hypothetical protein
VPKVWIVPDSNTLFADLTLTRSVAQKFANWCRILDARVNVPSVVRDEIVGHYRREVQEKAKAGLALQEKLETFGVRLPESWGTTLSEVCGDAVATFEQRTTEKMRTLGWEIAPYPAVLHETLVHDAVERRRPFAENGAGYRDALIWHSVLEIAGASQSRVLLVSKDGDFRAPDGFKLHSDLVADMRKLKVAEDSVCLVNGLAALYTDHVEPAEKALAELRGRFKTDEHAQSLLWNAIDEIVTRELNGRDLEIDGDDVHVQVRGVTEADLEADELWHEDGDLYLEGVVEVEVFFECEPAYSHERSASFGEMVGYVEVVWRAVVYGDEWDTIEPGDIEVPPPTMLHERGSFSLAIGSRTRWGRRW